MNKNNCSKSTHSEEEVKHLMFQLFELVHYVTLMSNIPRGSVAFFQIILISMILVQMIDEMVQVTKLPVSWSSSGGGGDRGLPQQHCTARCNVKRMETPLRMLTDLEAVRSNIRSCHSVYIAASCAILLREHFPLVRQLTGCFVVCNI